MRPVRVAMAALAIVPALLVTAYFVAGDVRALAQPVWASSQPKGEYVATMLVVKGILVAGIVVGFLGVAARNRRYTFGGAALLALGAFPFMLGGAGWLVLASAGMVLATAFGRASRAP